MAVLSSRRPVVPDSEPGQLSSKDYHGLQGLPAGERRTAVSGYRGLGAPPEGRLLRE